MARNGSGTYSLYTPGNPVVTGTTISSTWANNTLNDIATALTNSIAKDGQTTPTANLPMGTFKLTGLGAGSARTDSLNLGQSQDSGAKWLTGVAGTDTITASLSPAITAYSAGQTFRFAPANTNTGATTININSVGAKNIYANGSALTAGILTANVVYEIVYDGTQFNVIGGVGIDSVTARSLADSAVANTPILNGYIDWAISGNALTASIKTLAGADPSSSDPVLCVFRDATVTNGGYVVRSVTAATSVTASSGSTLGTVSAQASRIRAVLVDDSGTVVLGLYNSWDNTNRSLLAIDESAVYTTTAEGGAGGADSAHVIYTTAGKTSKAVREAGYVESTQTTAGTWAQALDKKVTAGVGYRRTGDRVQERYLLKTDTYSNTTSPANVTGLELALTPRSAANKVLVTATLNVGASSTQIVFLRLVRDAVSIFDGDAAGVRRSITQSVFPSAASVAVPASMIALDSPNSGTSVTYSPQIWGPSGTQYINRSGTDSNTTDFTRAVSSILVQEIFA
jgi:hypothetical protein